MLGVAPGASPDEVAEAYRVLAKRWHPDRAESPDPSGARMAEINAAYDLVRDGPRPVLGVVVPDAPVPRRSEPPPRRPGDWLPEAVRRALGGELAGALHPGEAVEVVTPAATWRSPRAILAVTDQRLLWLADDAISARIHHLRFRDVVSVTHRLRRPLRRTAVLEVRTRSGRRLEWAELTPPTAERLAGLVAERIASAP